MADRDPDFFSYIVASDSGFAPNPYGGICTLACSKPNIRQSANVGDWIIGTAPSPDNGKLVYAMQVGRGLTFDMYWEQPEYEYKKPSKDNGCGDNIYRKGLNGALVQVKNQSHSEAHFERDTHVNRVLISKNFYYFGNKAPEIPLKTQVIIHSVQGHKRIRPADNQYIQATRLIEWLQKNFKPGMIGEPGHPRAKCKLPPMDSNNSPVTV